MSGGEFALWCVYGVLNVAFCAYWFGVRHRPGWLTRRGGSRGGGRR